MRFHQNKHANFILFTTKNPHEVKYLNSSEHTLQRKTFTEHFVGKTFIYLIMNITCTAIKNCVL